MISDYEEFDRHAGDCARAAIQSARDPFTIEGICRALRRPIPVRSDDLRALAHVCARWGIRTNLDGDMASWDLYRAEVSE